MRQPGIRARVVASAVLAVVFVAMTLAVTAGAFASLDRQVGEVMHSAWRSQLHPLFQVIAELGGVEVTSLLMFGLVIYLLRAGFGSDAFVFIAFVIAQVLEILYKLYLHHPGPPATISQADGPSISLFLGGAVAGNSFPSGHMARSVIVYGMVAFVVRRMSTSRLVRWIALAAVILLVLVMAFDRVYLNVHWESDVVGGLLLGAIGLTAGTVWLDRPRRVHR